MRRIGITLATLALIAFVSCKNQNEKADKEGDMTEETMKMDSTQADSMENKKMEAKSVSVTLESKSDSKATGQVLFSQQNGIVNMRARISGLTPGTHAIHIHEKADCSSPDGKSAGGHWNPTFEPHGKWGAAEGYHKGDIGNFVADAEGNGTISLQTDQWCIGCGDEKKDILGKGIIVHEGTDDFTSQPSGDAGARVSCGGIIQ